MIFRPKIVIGSLLSILLSIIALIAIFFPSLLNIERSHISILDINLVDSKDYQKLYNFLYDNQEKIVKLNITYKEIDSGYFLPSQAAELTIDNFINFNDKKKYKLLSNNNSDIKSRYGFGIISDYAYVFSDFTLKNNNLFREHGSIGVWINSNDNSFTDISYIILIPEDSNSNTLYNWNTVNLNYNIMMNISGTFYVNKFIDESLSTPMFKFMPFKWYKKFWKTELAKETVIELNPIDTKNSNKYKY